MGYAKDILINRQGENKLYHSNIQYVMWLDEIAVKTTRMNGKADQAG